MRHTRPGRTNHGDSSMTDQPTQPTPGQHVESDLPHPGGAEMPAGRRILPPRSAGDTTTRSGESAVAGPRFAPGKMPSGGLDRSQVVVPLVATLVAVLAIFWFASGPEDTPFADARDEIESIDDLNNESTAGAPQQEVVNGWTTIEYLNLLSTQQEHENNRRDALLLLILLSGLAAYTHHHLRMRESQKE